MGNADSLWRWWARGAWKDFVDWNWRADGALLVDGLWRADGSGAWWRSWARLLRRRSAWSWWWWRGTAAAAAASETEAETFSHVNSEEDTSDNDESLHDFSSSLHLVCSSRRSERISRMMIEDLAIVFIGLVMRSIVISEPLLSTSRSSTA